MRFPRSRKKGRVLAAWPWLFQLPGLQRTAAAARCHSCETVVRESGGGAYSSCWGVLDYSLQDWLQSSPPSSRSEQAMGMWKLEPRAIILCRPLRAAQVGWARPAARGRDWFLPLLGPWRPCFLSLPCGLGCAPYLESLRAPDFLFHPLGLLPSWKHR